MKRALHFSIILILGLLFLAALPTPAYAQPVDAPSSQDGGDGKIVMGGFYRLESGDTLNGGLLILGGQGVLEQGSTVNGDILIAGGTLEIGGTVNGDIAAVGGVVNLNSDAVIMGDVATVGGTLQREDGAIIKGNLSFDMPGEGSLQLPWNQFVPGTQKSPTNLISNLWQSFQPMRNLLWKIFQAFALAALAAILSLFLLKPMERVSETITTQPVLGGGLGLLTILVAPALSLILIITIILIPLGIIGLLGIGLGMLFGWLAIGYEVGKRIENSFHQDWAPAVVAGIGTLALTLLSQIINWIPCLGFTLSALVATIGLGGVILSRFGTQVYVPHQPATPTAPTAPVSAAPQPPAPKAESGAQNLLKDLELNAAEETDFEEPLSNPESDEPDSAPKA